MTGDGKALIDGGDGGVHAILLAAGQSRRMGTSNKLLLTIDGEPMVRRVLDRIAAAKPAGIIVVTGHERAQIEAALRKSAVRLVHNAAFASGMAGSLRHGLRALPSSASGALIALADMPALETADYGRLIEAFAAAGGDCVIRAMHEGRPGNPVILPKALFALAESIEGDRGARDLVSGGGITVVPVEIGAAARLDIDSPPDIERLRALR